VDHFYSWFQWALGIAIGMLTAIVAWIGNELAGQTKDMAKFQSEVAVLQSQPKIDPIAYTKQIGELANAMNNLANQLTILETHRVEEFQRLREDYSELRQELRELKHIVESKGVSRAQ